VSRAKTDSCSYLVRSIAIDKHSSWPCLVTRMQEKFIMCYYIINTLKVRRSLFAKKVEK
jgi:hypothetical protein